MRVKAAKEDLSNGYDVIIGGDFNEPSHLDWIDATSYIHNHNGLTVSWTVTKLCDEAGFIDAYRHINPNPVTHPGFTYPSDNEHASIQKLTWAPKADERERIDYVFYQGKNIEAKQAAIFGPNSSIVRSERLPETSQDVFIEPLDVWPTDHKGVLITFGIKRE